MYQKLCLESLKDKRWLRHLCYLYKIASTKMPPYLYELLPPLQRLHCFLFPTISEWNELDPDIRNVDTYLVFRKNLLAFIRPIDKSPYTIYDPLGIKLLHRIQQGFSHLHEHKFKHNFADTMNPLCLCSLEIESINFYAATIMSPFELPL